MVVVACVLPLCALSLGTQFVSYRNAREAAGHRTLELARSLSLALDQELKARIGLLQVLALSRRLQDGDIDGFRAQAQVLIAQQLLPEAGIILFRDDGQQIMNTALPMTASLPSRSNLDTIRQVFATAKPSVSGLFASSTDGHPVVAIEVPVLNARGEVIYVLTLNPSFNTFTEIIRRQKPSDGWVAALVDRRANIIARIPDDYIGRPAAPELLERLLVDHEGIVEATSLEGTPVLSAFSHTENFGWGAAVGVPEAKLTAQPRWAALSTLAAGTMLLMLGLIAAASMARRITGPIAALRRLAAAVEGELSVEPLANTLPETAEVAAALMAAARERHLALEAGAVGIFNWNLREGHLDLDVRIRAIWAVPKDTPAGVATLYAGIHPDDRAKVTALFDATRRSEVDNSFAGEYRVIGLADGVQRVVETRGRVIFAEGRPARLLGTVIDITERRAAEERQTLLAREVDHRSKNVLAVVQSIVRMTPRTVSPIEFAASIEGRVTAMARAHSVLAAEHWVGANLRTIIEGEIAIHATHVRIEGPTVRLTPAAAQPIAILLHELVTNAAKHGALAFPGGTVDISWHFQPEGALQLDWTEHADRTSSGEPAHSGFGTRLISSLAERQLGGTLQRQWLAAGLFLSLTVTSRHAQAMPGTPRPADARTYGARSSALVPFANDTFTVAGRAARVLVVEDEALLAMELEHAIRTMGCEVIGPARSLSEAVRLAAGEPRPDAAVLDVNLAGEMVFPAADILTTRGIPMLFATGYGSAPNLAEHQIKAVAILRKPYPQKLLADAIHLALSTNAAPVEALPFSPEKGN